MSTNRKRWLGAVFAAAAVTPLGAVPAAAATPPAAVRPAETSVWAAGNWQGSTPGVTSQTVQDIAKYVGAANTGLDGTGVGIALVDTGVAPVPGLPAAQIVNGPDLSFESQAPNLRYLDTYGHGTHLAGIMVGNDTTAGLKGISPRAKLTSVKVGTADGAVDVSQVIAAIDWVVEHRNDDTRNPIRVLNLSYGTNSWQESWRDPIAAAAEHAWRAGIVVVVSGGNGGSNPYTLTNPAMDEWVLSVGSATTKGTAAQGDDELSSFSQRSWARNVDLVAPGEGVVSLRLRGSDIDQTYPAARIGDRLFRGSGTSQAAAVVSSSVALLLQKRPTLTPDQVKALLKSSGTTLTSGSTGSMGVKELNLAAALTAPVPAASTQLWAKSGGNGSLEIARGGVYVAYKGLPLRGEFDIFGPFNASLWVLESANGTAWSGGFWLGRTMAGSSWNGTSWASRTWGAATWAGGPWGAATTWHDDTWNSHHWTGNYWSGNWWSGNYWSSDMWASSHWG